MSAAALMLIVSASDALVYAILAVALSPFVLWVWSDGTSEKGTSQALRRLAVVLWLAAFAAAVYGTVGS